MDEAGRSHFAVEVEDLDHRISTLRDSITSLHQTFNARKTDMEERNMAVEKSQHVISEVETALVARTDSEPEFSPDPELCLAEISLVRSQLMKLGKVESELSERRPERASSSTALVAVREEESLVTTNTLQLWQEVFQDTLARYNRLSALLASQQAKDLALRVWENHLDQVSEGLAAPPSNNYMAIAEQMRIISLHRNLLLQSQQLLLRQPSPSQPSKSVTRLVRRNQEVLQRMEERNDLLRERQAMWDRFSVESDKLQAWLREMEREKQLLNLKHVALKRVPTVLNKIQQLLEKVPAGEKLLRQLTAQQTELRSHYEAGSLAWVKVELHGVQERLSSLKAGLLTWSHHLSRLHQLAGQTDQLERAVSQEFEAPALLLDSELPPDREAARAELELCRDLTERLSGVTASLEELGNLQEELKEAVSPSDMKALSQRSWLLSHRQTDLKHKLAVRTQQLEARAELLQMFNSQLDRFLTWHEKMEVKLEGRDFPVSDLIHHIEHLYQPEILAKEKDLTGLKKIKTLIAEANWAEKEDVAEETTKAEEKYEKLREISRTRLAKLNQILTAQLKLETELRELKLWLSDFENKISEPWKFAGVGLEEYKKNTKSLAEIERKVQHNSEKINTTLNRGELVLNDGGGARSSSGNIFNIQSDLTEVQDRWRDLCSRISEKKKLNEETWSQWQIFIEKSGLLHSWIENHYCDTDITQINLADCKDKLKHLEDVMKQINDNLQTLDDFNAFYCRLAREGKLDEGGEVKRIHSTINEEWERLSSSTVNQMKKIAEKADNFECFAGLQEKEMTWARQIDAQLTEIQFSSRLEDGEKREKLRELRRSVELRLSKVEEVKMMCRDLLEQCNAQDYQTITNSLQDLTNLSSDVKQRLEKLLGDLCVDDQNTQHQNVQVCFYSKFNILLLININIKVDTLKFEQDRSVQANTLSTSGVFLSTNISASPATPDDAWPDLETDELAEISGLADRSELELTNQLDQLIEDCTNHLLNIEQNIHTWNDRTFLVCFIHWWWWWWCLTSSNLIIVTAV